MILYAQNGRNARNRSICTNEEQVPKLDVVGSSPISRSIESIIQDPPSIPSLLRLLHNPGIFTLLMHGLAVTLLETTRYSSQSAY
jgi:hypothetical protein